LLDERRDAGRQKRAADLGVQLGRRRDRDGVHLTQHVAIIEGRPGSIRRGDVLRARPVDVDDSHELDARQRRGDAGVMPAEVPDADDGNLQAGRAGWPGWAHRARPTMAIAAASAARTIASPSIISVLPASTDSTVAPARAIASIVEMPITGTSNR